MHRSITAALVVGLLLLAMAAPAAAKPEATGPPCADILNPTGASLGGVTANYTTEAAGPTVSFLFELYAPSCPNVRYAGYVYNSTGTTLLVSGSVPGDGAVPNEIGLSLVVPSDHNIVCVYAATESAGGRVFDRAPDADGSCVQLTIDTGTGLSKFG